MKRSDFMRYKGKSKLPYRLSIRGFIEPSKSIPEDVYSAGDAWIIQPDNNANEFGSFIVFYDGSQFRLPRVSCADVGSDRHGKVVYILDSELSNMFGHDDQRETLWN